jgi:hypothetical protein
LSDNSQDSVATKPEKSHNDSPTNPGVPGTPAPPTLEVLRAKLDAAIVAEAWDAVKAIRDRMAEMQRADVVDLAGERARRGR